MNPIPLLSLALLAQIHEVKVDKITPEIRAQQLLSRRAMTVAICWNAIVRRNAKWSIAREMKGYAVDLQDVHDWQDDIWAANDADETIKAYAKALGIRFLSCSDKAVALATQCLRSRHFDDPPEECGDPTATSIDEMLPMPENDDTPVVLEQ